MRNFLSVTPQTKANNRMNTWNLVTNVPKNRLYVPWTALPFIAHSMLQHFRALWGLYRCNLSWISRTCSWQDWCSKRTHPLKEIHALWGCLLVIEASPVSPLCTRHRTSMCSIPFVHIPVPLSRSHCTSPPTDAPRNKRPLGFWAKPLCKTDFVLRF